MKLCWREKQLGGWQDLYSKERKRYYNRNGWGIQTLEGMDTERTRIYRKSCEEGKERLRQEDGSMIEKSWYNPNYKLCKKEGRVPPYLDQQFLKNRVKGGGIKALIRIRCGKEEGNKYWLEEKRRYCVFYNEGQDNICRYLADCVVTRKWFSELSESIEDRYRNI